MAVRGQRPLGGAPCLQAETHLGEHTLRARRRAIASTAAAAHSAAAVAAAPHGVAAAAAAMDAAAIRAAGMASIGRASGSDATLQYRQRARIGFECIAQLGRAEISHASCALDRCRPIARRQLLVRLLNDVEVLELAVGSASTVLVILVRS